MPWFDEPEEKKPEYVMIAKIIEEHYGRIGNTRTNYSMRYEGKIPHAKVDIVLKKFIDNIDNEAFVTLDEIKVPQDPYSVSHIIFGRPVNDDIVFYFYILKDEIPKIDTDELIHIVCQADKFPKSKENFLEIVKMFM